MLAACQCGLLASLAPGNRSIRPAVVAVLARVRARHPAQALTWIVRIDGVRDAAVRIEPAPDEISHAPQPPETQRPANGDSRPDSPGDCCTSVLYASIMRSKIRRDGGI